MARTLLAKSAAVLGLGWAAFYGWLLASVLSSLYSPVRGFCATPEVIALTGGAVVVAPIALLLVFAMARLRAGITERRNWRAISLLAGVALLGAVGTNWLVLLRLVLP